ncbi:MAG: glutathione S-transferase family protein [Deltaproteobacteria bacterium]|nr:glutathione S-transferase family protein [Deltaproteobacteria bacterium]
MTELILHHYPMSPFSEKVRKVFAAKRLAWRGVEQPMWNPKPQLVPLTGGYRRIPVLQIGADVYCDTACILREIEARHPQPTIFPGGTGGAAEILAWWADRQLFMAAATLVLAAMGPSMPPEFKADREKMVPGLRIDALAEQAPHAKNQLRAYCDALNRQLADRAFVLGDAFSLADAACFHVLWFARMDPAAARLIAAAPAVAAWFDRVDAMGHGASTPLSADEALAIAARSDPATPPATDPADPNGAKPGDRVTVTADDYALDPVAGQIVALTASDIAIRRRDPQVGEIVVHFPQAGFRLAPA